MMVAEDVLQQLSGGSELSPRGPSKPVKINRTQCMVDGSRSNPDPHRRRTFNGDQKREQIEEDPGKKEPSPHQRSHNGCTEVDSAQASETLLQEDVVSRLPRTTSGVDENSNLPQEDSEDRKKHRNSKEQELSHRISDHSSDAPDHAADVRGDPPDHEEQSENDRDQLREPKDSRSNVGGKVYKEKENFKESSKKRDQRGREEKKLKEHNEDVKDHPKRKDKVGTEKGETQEKAKDRIKKEDHKEKTTGTGSKNSSKEKHKDHSKSKEDKHKDHSKEDKHKDHSKEDKHKDHSKEDKHKDHSKEDKHKDHSKEDKHKDHSKEDKHKDPSKEDKHKDHSQRSKHEKRVKKEKESDIKGSPVKRILVDLDLFQESQTEDKKHKSKDLSKGKSRIKKETEEIKQKDESKKHNKKDHKREENSEETKGIKRELEDEEEEPGPGQKKPKPDPEGKEKAKSKKRKTAGKEGETKAKRIKEEKQEESKWKWWEEKNHEDGVKWKFLEHRGPYFAPAYEPLPDDVNFYYDGQPMKLSPAAEEVATFYGKMLDHEYTTKEIFQKNFYTDWKSQMTKEEQKNIKQLHKCDFSEIHKYFFDKNEARKALPKEEKQKLKEETNKIQEEYGFCILDGHREKIGNFKIEPPGLFRGRGDHPKMGMLKLRILPEDVIINCSKDSKVPEPPPGHRWKEVRYDNTVTWLASWTENVQGSFKYIMLNPSSKLKGEKDWQKYEIARRLKNVVDQIRSQYRLDWKSREMRKRQRAVALYFIDKLALRAGNEKEEGETADTVGCCSLRVEHIKLYSELDAQQYVVEFDFLGKDSIRYYNKIPVEKEVFKNLKLFMEKKNPDDDLFDRLNTSILNKHLQDLMDGLTAKVFRTYNASITLQNQLKELTNPDDNVAAKILSYNRANRAVALLCNHQRAPPKTFEKSMQNLQAKIDAKQQQLKEAKKELKKAKADYKNNKAERYKKEVEKKKKQVERLEEQLMKLKLQATDKEENKQIALGTSKLNYLDPRITVAWCKKYGVPIEKIYNKTQREKFAWAIDMTNEDFEF